MTAPVYAVYVGNAPLVKAAQLTEESADEIIRWTLGYRLGRDRWIPQEGCWRVSAQRWYPPFKLARVSTMSTALWFSRPTPDLTVLVVGLRTRQGEQIAREGDWIIQGTGGAFSIVHRDDFGDLYQPAVDTVEAR